MYKTDKELAGSALRRAELFYDQVLKDAGIGGTLVMEVVINEQGDVIATRRISGHLLLESESADAVRAWKFSPTLIKKAPVKVVSMITFDFVLDEPQGRIVNPAN